MITKKVKRGVPASVAVEVVVVAWKAPVVYVTKKMGVPVRTEQRTSSVWMGFGKWK